MRSRKQFLIRLRIVSFGVLAVALFFLTRLFFVQIVHGVTYSEQANNQYARPAGGTFDRGTIYMQERDGSFVSAATLQERYNINIQPMYITNPEETYKQLSSVLSLDRDAFIARAQKEDDPHEQIARGISEKRMKDIQALELDGIQIETNPVRFYPGGDLAAKTIGFIAYDGNNRVGRYGLERYYNDVLSKEATNPYINFFAEVFTNLKKTLFSSDENNGDVVTTINPTVQQTVEEQISDVLETYQAESVGAIVLDPQTGAIKAMAHVPQFDLNAFSTVSDPGMYSNPLVENVFEFGSVIKPLVMAAGIETNAVSPETEYYDSGSVEVEGKVIENFDQKGRGHVTMRDVLIHSLNTGMVLVSEELSREAFREYMLSYGFDEETGIDLPSETTGLVGNLESNRDIEFANISFGQGIAVTPIAAIRAFAGIANDGVLPTPYLGEEIRPRAGFPKDITPQQDGRRVLDEKTATTITNMLVGVVDEGLTDIVRKERYSIAAKTGTAQMPSPDGGYDESRRLHSFFGYVPAYDPAYVIFMYAVEPQGVQYASQSLAPRFRNIVDFLINYYSIPPDR